MEKDRPWCLVLSGGGAKGVYHIGAWRALRELGVEVDAFVGNSIGALVAPFMALGLSDELEAIAKGIGIDFVLKVPPELVKDGELSVGIENLAKLRELARDFVKKGGLDTAPLRALLERSIDEARLRASGKDLGIVTVSLTELQPRELFLEAMEDGHLVDYLMASAAVPGFVAPVIKGKKYVDGGVHDNLPYTVALKRGYRRVIVVDISGLGINRRPRIEGTETVYVKNSIEMGGILDFDREFLERFTELGYLDTKRAFGQLDGYAYFLEPDAKAEKSFRTRLGRLGTPPARALLEPSGPIWPERMRHDRRLLLKSLECAALSLGVERVRAWTYVELEAEIRRRKALEDARLEAIAEKAKISLLEAGVEAAKAARLDECPYWYASLVSAFPKSRPGALVRRALESLTPELKAALAFLELSPAD